MAQGLSRLPISQNQHRTSNAKGKIDQPDSHLPDFFIMRARQLLHEVHGSSLKVSRLLAGLAHGVIQMLLDEGPVPSAIYPRHLPASRTASI